MDQRASSRLDAWLQANVPGYKGPATLAKIPFGQSNPTFRLTSPSGCYVLRRKPPGPLLPKAHAIEREYRVLRALEGTGVPVPVVHALCSDESVIGTAFFVMDFIAGRTFYDQSMPGLSRDERAAIFDDMNRAVVKLHSLEPARIGLADFGRADSFLQRQIALWTRQYRASATSAIDAMERLIEWLPANTPPEQPARIFHGDLRIDNMIFHPREPRVLALLDWELSTLGDPVADLAHHVVVWRIPTTLFRGFLGLDWRALGIPTESEYLNDYCERSATDVRLHWNFYLAFCLFRLAAILQGVHRRAIGGNASAADAADVGARAAPVAELGWRIANAEDS